MPRWKKTGRMRRAYLDKKPGRVFNSALMQHMNGKVIHPAQIDPFNDLSRLFSFQNEAVFNKIKQKMEKSMQGYFEALHNRRIKEEYLHVVLQKSKHFKLVLFWASGVPKYHFIKHEDFKGLISVSQPYVSRDSAMDAFEHRDIFWLDFIRIG